MSPWRLSSGIGMQAVAIQAAFVTFHGNRAVTKTIVWFAQIQHPWLSKPDIIILRNQSQRQSVHLYSTKFYIFQIQVPSNTHIPYYRVDAQLCYELTWCPWVQTSSPLGHVGAILIYWLKNTQIWRGLSPNVLSDAIGLERNPVAQHRALYIRHVEHLVLHWKGKAVTATPFGEVVKLKTVNKCGTTPGYDHKDGLPFQKCFPNFIQSYLSAKAWPANRPILFIAKRLATPHKIQMGYMHGCIVSCLNCHVKAQMSISLVSCGCYYAWLLEIDTN